MFACSAVLVAAGPQTTSGARWSGARFVFVGVVFVGIGAAFGAV